MLLNNIQDREVQLSAPLPSPHHSGKQNLQLGVGRPDKGGHSTAWSGPCDPEVGLVDKFAAPALLPELAVELRTPRPASAGSTAGSNLLAAFLHMHHLYDAATCTTQSNSGIRKGRGQ